MRRTKSAPRGSAAGPTGRRPSSLHSRRFGRRWNGAATDLAREREPSPARISPPWADPTDRGFPVPNWDVAGRLAKAGVAAVLVASFALGGGAARDANAVFWR